MGATTRRFAVGITVIVAALAYLLVSASTDEGLKAYYLTVSEFQHELAQAESGGGKGIVDSTLKVSGKVVPGTIRRDTTRAELRFTITDIERPDTAPLAVVYHGVAVPDTFKDEAHTVVTGRYATGVFEAHELMAKCPSKFEAREPEGGAAHVTGT